MANRCIILLHQIFLLGLMYGSLTSYILQSDDNFVMTTPLKVSFILAILLMLSSIIIFIFLIFIFKKGKYGICMLDKKQKALLALANILFILILSFVIQDVITFGNGIPYSYAWMHVLNLLFSYMLVFLLNYNAKMVA